MAASKLHLHPRILLTSALSDVTLAERVSAILEASGIHVGRANQAPSAQHWGRCLRKSIEDSDAIVVVISRATSGDRLPASLLFEVGAAFGASKRVYVVLEDMSRRLDFSVPDMHVLPVSRVEELKYALASIAA